MLPVNTQSSAKGDTRQGQQSPPNVPKDLTAARQVRLMSKGIPGFRSWNARFTIDGHSKDELQNTFFCASLSQFGVPQEPLPEIRTQDKHKQVVYQGGDLRKAQ